MLEADEKFALTQPSQGGHCVDAVHFLLKLALQPVGMLTPLIAIVFEYAIYYRIISVLPQPGYGGPLLWIRDEDTNKWQTIHRIIDTPAAVRSAEDADESKRRWQWKSVKTSEMLPSETLFTTIGWTEKTDSVTTMFERIRTLCPLMS
jgi:hypothetical protein